MEEFERTIDQGKDSEASRWRRKGMEMLMCYDLLEKCRGGPGEVQGFYVLLSNDVKKSLKVVGMINLLMGVFDGHFGLNMPVKKEP